MLSLLISAVASFATTLLLQHFAGFDIWVAIFGGVIVFAGVYFLLLRFIMKKVQVIMDTAQRDIQANRTEKAIKVLQQGYRYAAWQFYLREQINSQIGAIYYLKRDFSKAFEFLQKGFFRNWSSMAMLAICYMHKKQNSKMISTFDKALAGNKKEDMLYNLYAFCLDRIGEREKAIKILEKGLGKVADKEAIQVNLDALKEGKKMKMKQYGDLWYQFHLEKPGALIKKQTRAIQGRRKIVRR
ncbi:hypothetical protein EDC39_10114 [Geothermobacter ehrlichii]|uniref:Tetratricopeptide repeat protein n=1 Tax=Geothermobacter ehrlichii TaxID=213224 RepID=A0A5D3WMX6_9BACT|nr:hypothetical protein [Geothermobacter ehrlichii]TYO99854.1 hypothetical protein EDC39_10114 [Geothermobacter ehrlichii]